MKQSPIPIANLLSIIEEAKHAELCRDNQYLRKILDPIWTDIEQNPDFSEYEPSIRAELLRCCGVFLSFHGIQKQLKNYQERGKDLLTQAIEIFDSIGFVDKASEAKVMLAYCYWNEGEISEAETILDDSEQTFGKNPIHPVYLHIQINRLLILFFKRDIQTGLRLIEDIKPAIEFVGDVRLQAQFHNQAGLFYRGARIYEKGVFHLNEAIRYAEKANNKLFIAINFNNLAFLYKEIEDFEKSINCINDSIIQFNQLGHFGFLAHALDTKAQIFFELKDFEKALEVINQSIGLFEKGEDYRGYCDSLFTKALILLRLNRKDEALLLFGELTGIAKVRINQKSVEKYAESFADEIYALQGLALADEVSDFKKSRISSALLKANGVITEAARMLRLKNHQALSEILNNQFPNLYTDLGFRRRARRQIKKKEFSSEIALLDLPGKSFSFDFYLPQEKYQVFYFDSFFMRKFGLEIDAIVAVVPVELQKGISVLVLQDEKFLIGKTEYDKDFGIYYLLNDAGEPVPLDQNNIIGRPVGYCPLAETEQELIKFARLET